MKHSLTLLRGAKNDANDATSLCTHYASCLNTTDINMFIFHLFEARLACKVIKCTNLVSGYYDDVSHGNTTVLFS